MSQPIEPPRTMPKAIYGHTRTQLHNGWSWAIEVPGEGYRIRDSHGLLMAKNARDWWIAAQWAQDNSRPKTEAA